MPNMIDFIIVGEGNSWNEENDILTEISKTIKNIENESLQNELLILLKKLINEKDNSAKFKLKEWIKSIKYSIYKNADGVNKLIKLLDNFTEII